MTVDQDQNKYRLKTGSFALFKRLMFCDHRW